jgi:2,3-bisphosphoglycerate-independent phosphoglycerate mutase
MEKLKLIGKFAKIDYRGNLIITDYNEDFDFLAEILDGIEIDGILFEVKHTGSGEVEITMSGKNLSDKITPNYTDKQGVPLYQIRAKKPEAKFTANVLDKFIRKCNKILTKGNHKFNVIMIKEAELIESDGSSL